MREPIKLRVFYFLLYSAFASWLTFFNVHLQNLGFTGLQIGIANSVFISTSMFVVPFWGMMGDKYGSNRIILLLTVICTFLVFSIGQTTTYSKIIFLIIFISVFQAPIGAVMDGMTLGFVRSGDKYSYGQFRLWGSAGFAAAAVLSGYVAGKDSSNIFLLASIFFAIISIVNFLTLPPKPITGRGLVNFRSISIFFRNRQILSFFFLIFLFGISISPLHHFINLYYTEIGATGSQIGLAFAVQASVEIPFFLYGARFVKRNSAEKIILLSMIISLLRMVLYGFTSDPTISILIGSLHGFTISFFLIGIVDFVQNKTPSHLRTTGQSLIWAFHFGAGLTIGNIWLGFLKDRIGMQNVMHVQAILGLLVIIMMLVFFRNNSRKEKSS